MGYPVGWLTPKINWASGNGVTDTDTNRIENNVKLLGESVYGTYTGSFSASINPPYFSETVTKTWHYTKYADIVFLHIPAMISPGMSGFTYLRIAPTTVWPDIILPTNETYVNGVLFLTEADEWMMKTGAIRIRSENDADWECTAVFFDSLYETITYGANQFIYGETQNHPKTLLSQTICYYTKETEYYETPTTTTLAP